MRTIILAALLLLGGAAARADEFNIPLKDGPGVDVVRSNCGSCHSVDYIMMNTPLPAQVWDAEVNKMIKVFGAPIDAADAKTIIEYLTRNNSG